MANSYEYGKQVGDWIGDRFNSGVNKTLSELNVGMTGLKSIVPAGMGALNNVANFGAGVVGLPQTGYDENINNRFNDVFQSYTDTQNDINKKFPVSMAKQQNIVTAPQGTSSQQRLLQENKFNNPTGDIQKEVNMLMNNTNTGYDPTAVTDLIRKQNQNRANALSSAVNTIPSNQQPNAFDLYKQNLNSLNNQRQINQAPQFSQVQQDLMYYDALDRKNEAKRQNDWADFMMSRSAKAKTKSGAANYANLAGVGLNQTQNTRASGDAINQLRNQFNQQVGMAGLNQNFNQQNQAYNSMSDMEKLRLQNSLGNDNAMRDFNNRLTLLDKETQLKLQDPTNKLNQLKYDTASQNPNLLFSTATDKSGTWKLEESKDGKVRKVNTITGEVIEVNGNSDQALLDKFNNRQK